MKCLFFVGCLYLLFTSAAEPLRFDPGVDLALKSFNFSGSEILQSYSKLFWSSRSGEILQSCEISNSGTADEIIGRCYSATTYTLRNFKIFYANQLANTAYQSAIGTSIQIYERMANDGALLATSYYYDATVLDNFQLLPLKLCLLGSFSAKIILFALISFEYIDIKIVPDKLTRQDKLMWAYINELAVARGRKLHLIKGGVLPWARALNDVTQKNVCNVVHFRGSSEASVASVLEALTFTADPANHAATGDHSETERVSNAIQIIWERDAALDTIRAAQVPVISPCYLFNT